MTTTVEILTELKSKGSDQTRKTFLNHGAPSDQVWGVKVGDMKPIAKKIKGNQAVAEELFESGVVDAMYLAGMVANGALMKKTLLDRWAKQAGWHMISEFAVPAVTCESPFARELSLKWMKSKQESVAACGWCTYSGVLAMAPDEELDHAEIQALLKQVESTIQQAPNRVRYTMNNFVISVGSYVPKLLKKAQESAKAIGKVDVNVGNTACKVPSASEYIAKIVSMGRVGKKRKTMKC